MTTKSIFLGLIICLFPFLGSSQKVNRSFTHWSGVELGFPTLTHKGGAMLSAEHSLKTDEKKSISFQLNFVEKKWSNTASGTGFLSGLSFGMDSYDWKSNIALKNNGDLSENQLQFVENTEEKYKYNQLNIIKVSVPLLLEINLSTNQKNHFHIASGFVAHWNISHDQYFLYNNEDGRFQNYRKQDVGVQRFSVDHTVRLGFGKYTFFLTQGITPLFKEASIKNIYAASFGLSIIPFDLKSEEQDKKYNIKERWRI
ncbi:MAG: hypothetical protein RLY35_780 [Bacteroidota bacterium]|jgi:hypothetical protein